MSATLKDAVPMTPAILRMKIEYAMWYLKGLYKEDANYGYMAEYYGFPLATVSQASGKIRQAGFYEWDLNNDKEEYTYLYGNAEDGTIEECDYDEHHFRCDFKRPNGMGGYVYGYPNLMVGLHHYSDGTIGAQIQVVSMTGDTQKLYLKDECLDDDLDAGETPSWWRYASKYRGWPTHRYGPRHGSLFGKCMFAAMADMTKSNKLAAFRTWKGFGSDLYDPIFGLGTGLSDSYFFATSGDPHRDCDFGTGAEDDALPWGMSPYRYAYESKFCTNRGSCGTYQSGEYMIQRSTFVKCLQAIHILNKYKDPGHTFTDGEYNSVTPSSVAAAARNKWNNIGLQYDSVGFPYPPADVALTYSTAVWNILETLLGYRYYDSTAREWADKAMERVFAYSQWGVKYPHQVDGQGEDGTLGVLRRNDHVGGFLSAYNDGSTYPFKYNNLRGTALGLIDMWFSMPDESYDPTPVGHESTALACQAMRTYLHYKYGVDCPTSAYLPG